jgi:hypothetical protein
MGGGWLLFGTGRVGVKVVLYIVLRIEYFGVVEMHLV